jgi:hypothetical protein
MFQSTLVGSLPQIWGIFLSYQILDGFGSRTLSGHTSGDSNKHGKLITRFTSLLHSCFVTFQTAQCMYSLSGRTFDNPVERTMEYLDCIVPLQSMLIGYECWELIAMLRRPLAFPRGALMHCLLDMAAFLTTMVRHQSIFLSTLSI